jgi:iron-sulfur cluster repair protein YtfE (RIC family)
MATTVELHARKEDEAFFPAVEAVLGSGFGPTEVMRSEHRTIRAQGELLQKTLRELRTIDHPALEAKREALRVLLEPGPTDGLALPKTAREILELLDTHFAKEEQILFPLARQILDATAKASVAAAFEGMH